MNIKQFSAIMEKAIAEIRKATPNKSKPKDRCITIIYNKYNLKKKHVKHILNPDEL